MVFVEDENAKFGAKGKRKWKKTFSKCLLLVNALPEEINFHTTAVNYRVSESPK